MADQTFQPSHDNADRIGPYDVLLGRGGATNNHIGNRRFRVIVSDHRPDYLKARKLEKAAISAKIVSLVYEKGGRFLRRRDRSETWEEVPAKRAQEKTSQALREGLDMRHGQPRLTKGGSVSSNSEESSHRSRNPYTIRKNMVEGKVVESSPISSTMSTSDSSNTDDSRENVPDVVVYNPLRNLLLLSSYCQ